MSSGSGARHGRGGRERSPKLTANTTISTTPATNSGIAVADSPTMVMMRSSRRRRRSAATTPGRSRAARPLTKARARASASCCSAHHQRPTGCLQASARCPSRRDEVADPGHVGRDERLSVPSWWLSARPPPASRTGRGSRGPRRPAAPAAEEDQERDEHQRDRGPVRAFRTQHHAASFRCSQVGRHAGAGPDDAPASSTSPSRRDRGRPRWPWPSTFLRMRALAERVRDRSRERDGWIVASLSAALRVWLVDRGDVVLRPACRTPGL